MKISKSLLKSIMIGVTIGGVAACSVVEEVVPNEPQVEEPEMPYGENHVCDKDCEEQCTESSNGEVPTWENCPACGMG